MKKRISIIMICVLAVMILAACSEEAATPDEAPATPAETTSAETNPSSTSEDDFNLERQIAVFTREDGSGTRDAFVDASGVGDDMSVEAAVLNSTGAIRTAVAENEFAISYVSVGSLSDEVRAISIDGVYPSDETVRDGSYPLQRRFLLVVTDDSLANPLVQDFLDFTLSAEGQNVVAGSWTPAVADPLPFTSSGMSGNLTISGSTSVAPAMDLLAEAYIALNPGVQVDVMSTGSGTGIEQATTGVVDIGMVSRELRAGEADNLIDIPIVLDGVAVIVNIANPITGLTLDQVRDIFVTGTLRWSDIIQ